MRIRARYVVSGAALTAIVALAVPAVASGGTTPSGAAQSNLLLLALTAGGESATVGSVVMSATGVTSPTALIDLVPAEVDGTKHAEKTVGPGESTSLSPVNATLPNGAGALTGPALTAAASTTGGVALAQAAASALGHATADGSAIDLGVSSLSDLADVTPTAAVSAKTLRISNIALPSIYALLTGMGLNLSALNGGQLESLYSVVAQTTSPAQAAAVLAAETKVGSSLTPTLAAAQTALAAAGNAETLAQNALQAQLSALTGPLLAGVDAALGLPPATTPSVGDLTPTTIPLVELADGGLTPAIATWQDAEAALTSAQGLVSGLTDLIGSVGAALAANPLAALNGVTLATRAVASNSPSASAVTTIGSADVLGTAASLTAFSAVFNATAAKLAAAVNSLAGGVSFSAPLFVIGRVSRSTGTSGGYRTAVASLTGVALTLPTISLPASLSISGRSVTTPAGQLTVASLGDSARFRAGIAPASTSPPATRSGGHAPLTATVATGIHASPSLPDTGLPAGVPAAALVLIGAALLTWRRLARAR